MDPTRKKKIERLRAIMQGRPQLEAQDDRGAYTLKHENGFHVVVGPTGHAFLETVVDRILDTLADAGERTTRAEVEALDGFDIVSVSAVALGDSRTQTPGFEGARIVGEYRPNPEPDGDEPDPYLDPARNPFLPGSTAQKEPDDVPDNLNPKKNPFIRTE